MVKDVLGKLMFEALMLGVGAGIFMAVGSALYSVIEVMS